MNGRTRSASLGRDKKTDLRARYWAFLFENLQHAVDELYQTCETDENISECKEVILVLENYTREFHNLAEWFRVKWEYENTLPPQRPNSLAWEIRKSSPGKVLRKKCQPVANSVACRELVHELNESISVPEEISPPKLKPSAVSNFERAETSGLEISAIKSDKNFVRFEDISVNETTPRNPTSLHVDNFAQTDDEFLSVGAKKYVVRKTLCYGASCAKKTSRSLSSSIVSESKSSTLSTSISSCKRFSGHISPIKPVPGRNIAAPDFVPGKKTVTNSGVEANAKVTTKIFRTQSDSLLETKACAEKPYTSVECVQVAATASNNESATLGVRSVSNSASVNSLDVIDETSTRKIARSGDKNEAIEQLVKKVDRNASGPSEDSLVTGETRVNNDEEHRSDETRVIVASTVLLAKNARRKSNDDTRADEIVKKTAAKQDGKRTPPKERRMPINGVSVADEKKRQSASKQSTSNYNSAVVATNARSNDRAKVNSANALERRRNIFGGKPTLRSTSRPTDPANANATEKIIKRTWTKVAGGNVLVSKSKSGLSERNDCGTSKSQHTKRASSSCATNEGEKSSRVGRACTEQSPFKPPDNDSFIAKCNSFQEDAKRSNLMIRSKTSIDMKRVHGIAETVDVVRGKIEHESSPRARRSSKDTDGWETVISRSRRSIPNSCNAKTAKFDVNSRFYEPSPSTSLPTLVTMETNGVNSKEKQSAEFKTKFTETKCKNRHRNNSYGNSNCNGGRDTMTRIENDQHSTVVDAFRDYKTCKERPIISSTAMFTTIQPKRKKPTGEKDGGRKTKVPKENKSAARKKSGGKESSERCTEELLDEESLRKSKELYEKEISLQKEINDLQNDADLETDADSDSAEVDQEIVDLYRSDKNASAFERRAALEGKYNHILSNMSWAEQIETLDKLEELLVRDPSGKSLKSAKNFTSLKQLEELVTRAPGRALELHQKLSSPSRKRISPDSTILQHKARQAKAKQNREQLLHDKSSKIRELWNKVAEVKAMQAQLANERRKSLEQKLKRAEENRNLHLRNIQEKAHDEAKKQKEIAFINELEAQNKRHDFYALCQEQEDRLQSILEERQRRQEEKAAKDAAVEERRKAIEAERQEKIEELQEKMRKREERIDRELQEKERERIKVAREKARDREDRLLALQAAQIANTEELQKKIQQKQENSARRHEENIELIRQKAVEIGTPRLTPYQVNKLCAVCNVLIDSEVFLLSHLKGKSHQEAVKKYREQFEVGVKFNECSIITDAPADVLHEKKSREKERQKTLRKRCKKIRHRLLNRSEEYSKTISIGKDRIRKIDSSRKGRILKSVKEIEKLISAQGNGVWPNNAVTMLERNLFEVVRILEKGVSNECQNNNDQFVFKEFDGFTVLSRIYDLALDLPKNMSPYLPLKCFVVTSNLFAVACHENVENCLYVLLSNNIVQILDFLLNRLNLIMPNSDDRNGMVVYKADTVADVLMNVCSIVLSTITKFVLNDEKQSHLNYSAPMVSAHLQDIVSYVVCTGIVDKLAVYCSSVHDNKSADSYFLLHCMELLTRLIETRRFDTTDKEDCTQLMATLKATELVGAVSMLYAMLLHQDSMSNDNMSFVAVLPPDVINVIIATLRLFSKVGELNLKFFQNILGAEGISLQVRHIISYLLRYCTQNESRKDLLHQVIEFIGFFAIHHTDNQMILQSGSTPTVLQQLSSLPFAYFSNPSLVKILCPTLLACCVGNARNRSLLDQEVSFQLLEDFRNAEDSKEIPLIKLLRVN